MAATAMSVDEQLKQLGDARKLVLGDANFYPQIIQGIIPIIGPEQPMELRRWGTDFLAETFSSPALPSKEKETLSLTVLEALKSMIENPKEDIGIVKSVVQAAASIYPHVFKWIINNPYDSYTWDKMVAIKTAILRIWDTASPGVRICCIKFAQRVVLVQTNGADADSKRSDGFSISLAMVPPNHQLLLSKNLEAEASGLLDRMLGIFQENISDAILIDATLNSIAILIRLRPHIANKILNAVLNFNPLKLANSPMTPRLRVMVKSMEKTTRMLLIHIVKRDPQNPLAGRIQQYVERLIRSRTEIFDGSTRKRGPPEPIDGLDDVKRQRLGAETRTIEEGRLRVPPLTPEPHSIAELYTVTGDADLRSFDVAQLSEDLVVKIGVTILSRIDAGTLDQAISGIRERLTALSSLRLGPPVTNANNSPLGVDDDEDDYEPDFQAAEDTEQILNKLDGAPPELGEQRPPDMAIGPYIMPAPPPLTREQASEVGQNTVSRVFDIIQSLEEPATKKAKTGINRLAASSYDRDAWITVITRLATRASCGQENADEIVKPEPGASESLTNSIRQSLYLYVLEDFRRRIDIAVSWLCEEWYNDQIQLRKGMYPVIHYDKWVLKLLDGILPYLDPRDKVLTRFLSEVPSLNGEILQRVKSLCRDPAMVNLALTSLLYIVMMRPPVRQLALDAVEDVWRTYDDAKPIAAKYLTRWRPGFLEQENEKAGADKAKLLGSNASPNGVAIST